MSAVAASESHGCLLKIWKRGCQCLQFRIYTDISGLSRHGLELVLGWHPAGLINFAINCANGRKRRLSRSGALGLGTPAKSMRT